MKHLDWNCRYFELGLPWKTFTQIFNCFIQLLKCLFHSFGTKKLFTVWFSSLHIQCNRYLKNKTTMTHLMANETFLSFYSKLIASFTRKRINECDLRNSIHTCNIILRLSILDYVRLSLMTLIEQTNAMLCATRQVFTCELFFFSLPFAHLAATFKFVLANHPVCVYSSLTLMRGRERERETKCQSERAKKAPVICIIFPLMRLEIVP